MERLDHEQLSEFHGWYDYLSSAFSGEERNFRYPMKDAVMKQSTKSLEIMESMEKTFRGLANRVSLVVKDDSSEFLFPGDIDDTILNEHLNFGDDSFFLIEASHHGGNYGHAFDNISTKVLAISRGANDNPRHEYYRDVPWQILVDTPRNGNFRLLRRAHYPQVVAFSGSSVITFGR